MAVDQFLALYCDKFGRVLGESLAKGHEEQLEVTDFKFHVTAPNARDGDNRNQAAAAPEFHAVEFTIPINTGTPPLFDALCSNIRIQYATLTMRKPTGTRNEKGAMQLYFQMRFSECRIIHFEISDSANTDPVLKIQIAYSKIEMVYMKQSSDGKLAPQGITASWGQADNLAPAVSLPDEKGWGVYKK